MHFHGWTDDDRERWQERAAIMEYEGGMPRDVAEVCAYRDVAAWRREQRRKG